MKELTRTLLIAALLLAAPLLLFAEDDEPLTIRPVRWAEVDDADGEALFNHLCAACHGESAKGDGPVADALRIELPDLTALSASNDGEFPLHEVEKTIYGPAFRAHGTRDMPVWGPSLMAVRDDWPEAQRKVFVSNRIRKLAKYLESIQEVEE